jgi:hypothetical protein
MFLKPMNLEECSDMIKGIGYTMAIEWSGKGLDAVYRMSGGHPYLARCLCSTIWHRSVANGHRRRLDTMDVMDAQYHYLVDPDNYIKRIWEKGHFDDREWGLLAEMARSETWSADRQSMVLRTQVDRDACERLQDYGLITISSNKVQITGDLMRQWIVTNALDLERKLVHVG